MTLGPARPIAYPAGYRMHPGAIPTPNPVANGMPPATPRRAGFGREAVPCGTAA
jgi:hypothetical protein